MNKIINYIKSYQDRRLRERCIKYASKRTDSMSIYVVGEADSYYKFIKNASADK